MRRVIYTVGTSIREKDEFFSLLARWGIKLIADVRRFPKSRFPYFSREALASEANRRGMRYLWFGEELGGYRKGGYERYQTTESFKRGLAKLVAEGESEPTAIVCAERFPWRCHRRFIARELTRLGFKVVHIIDEEWTWSPREEENHLFKKEKVDGA